MTFAADGRQLPHIPLDVGLVVVTQSLRGIQPLIVNARIEARQQNDPLIIAPWLRHTFPGVHLQVILCRVLLFKTIQKYIDIVPIYRSKGENVLQDS